MGKRTVLATNLRLLCSYCPSISAVSRDLGISRQQFTRYLSGKSTPSVNNLRKISDYFGVEETEILLSCEDFKELVAIKPPRVSSQDPMQAFVSSSVLSNASSRAEMKEYLGYYYSYFIMGELPDRITRALVHIYELNGAILTKNVERYPENSDGAAPTIKYRGVALYNFERLFIYESETTTGKRIWQTVVYASDLQYSKMLSGLTMGIASDTVRDIACYRVIYEFLGRDINTRIALRGCGTFPLDCPDISKFIRDRTSNDVRANETAFVPR